MAKQTKLRRQQLRRIHDIITRAEKKGYYFGSFKEEYKSYSTRKLKSLTAPQVKSLAKYIPNFSDIVLQNVELMIEDAKNASWGQYQRNGFTLEGYLKSEIQKYGRDIVAMACEGAPDEVIIEARQALRASTDEQCRQHSVSMVMIIESEIPTIEHSKEFSEQDEEFIDFEDYDEENPFL